MGCFSSSRAQGQGHRWVVLAAGHASADKLFPQNAVGVSPMKWMGLWRVAYVRARRLAGWPCGGVGGHGDRSRLALCSGLLVHAGTSFALIKHGYRSLLVDLATSSEQPCQRRLGDQAYRRGAGRAPRTYTYTYAAARCRACGSYGTVVERTRGRRQGDQESGLSIGYCSRETVSHRLHVR